MKIIVDAKAANAVPKAKVRQFRFTFGLKRNFFSDPYQCTWFLFIIIYLFLEQVFIYHCLFIEPTFLFIISARLLAGVLISVIKRIFLAPIAYVANMAFSC